MTKVYYQTFDKGEKNSDLIKRLLMTIKRIKKVSIGYVKNLFILKT